MAARKSWRWWLPVWTGIRLFAAAPEYRVDVWQTDDGLPQNTVTAIVQTRDGYLWVGTQGGLARFDGARFVVFDTHTMPALPSDRIVQLMEDASGTLWVGTELGGVAALRDGRFEVFPIPGSGSAHNYPRVFASDPKGWLWMTTCDWQLLRLAGDAFVREDAGWNLAGRQCYSVAGSADGVWIGTGVELAARDGENFRICWDASREPGFRVEALCPSRSGGCWVAANQRLRRFAGDRWAADFGAYTWPQRPLYDLYEDRLGRVWVATLGAGVHRCGPEGVRSLTTRDGLPTDFVRCVREDREGNVWIGTEGGGLCRLKASAFQVVGTREGLPSEQVLSVHEDADGGLWVGTNGDGLTRLRAGQAERFGPNQGLGNGHVWSVLAGHDGVVWAGTWGGLFSRGPDGRFVTRSDDVRISGQVLGLFDDGESLWIGQQGLGGVARIVGDQAVTPPFTGLPDAGDVRCMARTPDGALWLGTHGRGLWRCLDGTVTRLGRTDGLGADSIWALHADADGALWIGTYRGGLARWQAGRLDRVTEAHGLPDANICQILEDDLGSLWIGTYGGIWRVSRESLRHSLDGRQGAPTWFGLTKADGLPSTQCSGGFQPSGCRSRDGRLWFPTPRGLVVVDPRNVVLNPLPPPVLLEALTANDKPVPLGGRIADKPSPILLPPGTRQIEFRYTALSLTAPAKVRFRRRLEGVDRDWSAPESARTAVYNLSGPGRHRFTVTAANNDGLWNETGTSLDLEVLPQVWETRWFAGAAGLLSVIVVAGTARHLVRRSWKHRLERAEQEGALERERARIARDLHDDLGAGLTQVLLLSELADDAAAPAADQQARLNALKTRTRQLSRSLDEIVWAVNPRCDSVASLAAYLTRFAREFLVADEPRLRLDIPVDLPEVPLAVDLRHHLFLAAKEAFNNGVKHAEAREVSLRIRLDDSVLCITVTDDGRGFDLAAVNGSRSGLTNLRQRMADIGGVCDVASRPGHGTRVEFRLPLSTGRPR
ncbi:MAG: ATP-binding protein, partial [Verrucomicrobiae bacterium]|nr:ATP-binding protein [Verrucomicrobiae bacterium]